MRAGSLFSGVGGLDLGLARAGFEHTFFCESDEWRRRVLAVHWPGVPIYEDVRLVASDDGARATRGREGRRAVGDDERGAAADGSLGGPAHVDLLCGGFPCQDLSVAGQRRGLAGSRSSLFFEFARIIDVVQPRWVLVENVPGLLSSNGGRDFGVVLGTLADLGYGVGWRVLDSRFFGVPQRRRRVFIVGAVVDGDPRAAAQRAGQVLAVGTRCPGHPATRGEARQDVAVASLSGLGTGGPDDNDGQGGRLIAATIKAQRGKGGGGLNPEETLIADTVRSHPRPGSNSDGNLVELGWNWQTGGDFRPMFGEQALALQKNQTTAVGVRRLTPRECERLQALPDDWTAFGPDSRRYAALGDAVTSSVAEWIGRRLVAA